jgi:hypothetical protein
VAIAAPVALHRTALRHIPDPPKGPGSARAWRRGLETARPKQPPESLSEGRSLSPGAWDCPDLVYKLFPKLAQALTQECQARSSRSVRLPKPPTTSVRLSHRLYLEATGAGRERSRAKPPGPGAGAPVSGLAPRREKRQDPAGTGLNGSTMTVSIGSGRAPGGLEATPGTRGTSRRWRRKSLARVCRRQ